MASRNLKPSSVQGFDAANISDKMQSSTLKRQPSPDWSKADLLRLLSYFEGELQARDVIIATLKADKAKQLLYQAKYGRFGLGDPFVALQRDAEGKSDTGFDEAAIKSMYDNQLAQLENLIATQRKAQLKMREQLGNSEKRFHKLCTELEEEKQKHAQDTAQGDDVTYMLEKERERLKAEIDFEKSQNKKMEKDLKKTLASLEEERANAARHKQVAIMLIKERKSLIERVIAENQLRDEMETALTDEKFRASNMAEGLAQESKKSLKMEAAMEKQHSKFDTERDALRLRLQEEEKQTSGLRAEVARLSQQLEGLHQQVRSSGASPSSIQIRSSASPGRVTGSQAASRQGASPGTEMSPASPTSSTVSAGLNNTPPQAYIMPSPPGSSSPGAKTTQGLRQSGGNQGNPAAVRSNPKVVDGGRVGSSSPDREVIFRPEAPGSNIGWRAPGPVGVRMGPVGAAAGMDRVEVDVGQGQRVVNISPGSSATVTTAGGGKIFFHVGGGGSAPHPLRKTPAIGGPSASAGRGIPPPIPPNKPNLIAPGTNKPSPPPKVSGITVQGRDSYPSQYSGTSGKVSTQPRSVQIPVSVVGSSPPSSAASKQQGAVPGSSGAVASVRTQVRETSPSAVRKTSQCIVDSSPCLPLAAASPQADSPVLEFLKPEMANLQQLLASITTGETSTSNPHVTASTTTTPSPSSFPSASSSQFSSNYDPPSHAAGISTDKDKKASTVPLTIEEFTNLNSVDVSNNQDHVMYDENSKVDEVKIDKHEKAVLVKSGFAELVPHHEYDDHTTNSPSTYMVHHFSAPTAVSPALTSSSSSSSVIFSSKLTPEVAQTNTQNIGCQASLVLSEPNSFTVVSNRETDQSESSVMRRSRSKSPGKLINRHVRSSSASGSRTHSPYTSISPSSLSVPSVSVVLGLPDPRLSPQEVLTSPVHSMAVHGDAQALQSLVMASGGRSEVHAQLHDGTTPLHCAVEHNYEACVKILLAHGAKPSCLRDDRVTPLHIAAFKGHTGCLRALLSKGAAVNICTEGNLTPLHLAVLDGHLDCCQLLLRHGANILFAGPDGQTSIHYAVLNNQSSILQALLNRLKLEGTTRDSNLAHQLVAITNDDGWSIAHMAAHLEKQDCLIMLAENLPLDFDAKDAQGRSVKAVASETCKSLLVDIDRPTSPVLKVVVELNYNVENTTVSTIHLGFMEVGPGIGWRMMEDRLRSTLTSYLTQLDSGLRTRRISRLDSDMERVDKDFTLGLTLSNIKQFEMGFYKWTPGMQTDTSPYLILCNNEQKKITIIVDDADNMGELIAFDVLHPVSSINNYLRLLDQYKSVIFYGPVGSGKSYLSHRLAQSIAACEKSNGHRPVIYQLSLHPGYTFAQFLAFLKQKNCLVPINRDPDNLAPILLLDNLETVEISELFGELLDPIEHRGIGHAFCLRGDEQGANGMHFLMDQFYIIGTMNKSRSIGVDLSILPRFRWIQFRLDTEPLRGLLARHFLRRILNTFHSHLPSPDEPVLRAVEWVICVWQRLNDSLNKLGLPEVIMGPCIFFKCPLEKKDPKLILDWLKNMWNQQIAPRVRDAVKRGTGSEAPSDGQKKVANTALYVLMQRSVILSCPLSGQDKENYLNGFSGSNELDIPLKQTSENKTRGTAAATFLSPNQRGPTQKSRSGLGQHRTERGRSEGGEGTVTSSSVTVTDRNGQEEWHSDTILTSNIKRRSLSESSVNKAAQLEQQQHQQQFLIDNGLVSDSTQAKVARLETKSPKVVNILSAFRSSSLSISQAGSECEGDSQTNPILRKTGRVSPLLSLVSGKHTGPQIGQKKSRSSENISSSEMYSGASKLRSPGPFSFSLATPTSNLSSFKFLEKGDLGASFAKQMPDFSVFDKVPTPTDELPASRSFIFVGQSSGQKREGGNGKVEREHGEEEVWSRRTDVFIPIQQGESGRDSSEGRQKHLPT